MKSRIKDRARALLAPVADALGALGVAPNHLTGLGLLFSAVAGVAVATARFPEALVALILSGLCDMLDGAVARRQGKQTRFGAFLDSTADRVSELFFFAGLAVYFQVHTPSTVYLLLAVFALGGSFLVSYTRARAEGLGVECAVGWMERPERFVLLMLALMFGDTGLRVVLWVITPLVFWTSAQRVRHVRRASRVS